MNFEILESSFEVLKTNFMARSGEKVAEEVDHGVTQPWVTTRLTVGSGLAGRDPQRLVGASPTMTHTA
jgi:hypothetical protein